MTTLPRAMLTAACSATDTDAFADWSVLKWNHAIVIRKVIRIDVKDYPTACFVTDE